MLVKWAYLLLAKRPAEGREKQNMSAELLIISPNIFPAVTKMLQFTASPFQAFRPGVSQRDRKSNSEIPGSKPACGYPGLMAACHLLEGHIVDAAQIEMSGKHLKGFLRCLSQAIRHAALVPAFGQDNPPTLS